MGIEIITPRMNNEEKYIDNILDEFETITKELIQNKEKLFELKTFLDNKEAEYYLEVQSAIDSDGKALYKNDKLRDIAVTSKLKLHPELNEFYNQRMKSFSLDLIYDLLKKKIEVLKIKSLIRE